MDVQNFLTNKVGSEGLPILNKEDWTTVHADVTSDQFREEIAEWIVMHEPPYPRKVSLQNPQKADNKFLELCKKNMDKHIKPKEQTHDVLEKFDDYRRPYSSHGLGVIDCGASFNIISDYDMYEERMKCGSTHSPSPMEKWKDKKGYVYSDKIETSNSLMAEWLPLGSNRATAPNVRRGERVFLLQYADDDKYYWVTAGLDPHLRRRETVVFNISNTVDEIDDIKWSVILLDKFSIFSEPLRLSNGFIRSVFPIIVFSNSGKSAKLVSAMRPAAKIVTISPNINVCRQVSLIWGVQSINSRDANGWKDMMSISKEIIKKLKFIKKNDFVIITAGLPFGKAGMTNMIRLYKVGT